MAWDYDYTDGADIIDAMADEWGYCRTNDDYAYNDEDIAAGGVRVGDEDIPF